MSTQILPSYEYLRDWIEQIPIQFEHLGEVIYDDRNQIRRTTTPDGIKVCIKRFHQPTLINRWIYTFIRAAKAVRAYRNAIRLHQLGIRTPQPLGYILDGNTLIQESYLITLNSPLRHTFYELPHLPMDSTTIDLLRAFAQWTANLHQKGVLHRDFSPGNILYDNVNGQWQFEVVDINRMRFGTISPRMGCATFCRLWGSNAQMECIAHEYAIAMHIDYMDCLRRVMQSRARFWHNRPHQPFQYTAL